MRRAAFILLFLLLTAETPDMFCGEWHTPYSMVGDFFFANQIAKVQFYEIFIFALLFIGRNPNAASSRGMSRALKWAMATCVFVLALGVARGGEWKLGVLQIRQLIDGCCFALVLIKVLRTVEDFYTLGKVIVFAALWRAAMAIIFHFVIVRPMLYKVLPSWYTTHADSALFTAALIILAAALMEGIGKKKVRLFALFAMPAILWAIQLNNRRLAWLSLVGGLVILYIVYPANPRKKKWNRALLRVSPFILAYVVIGKPAAESGNPPAVFKPLSSIFSAADKNNPSTRSRLAENMGLLITYMTAPILGTGFGKEYIEVDNTLSARDFIQYRYITHNSVLGMFAFCGVIGFFRIWMVFPVSVYLNARVTKLASDPLARACSAAAIAEVIIVENQAYGDMGLFTLTPLLVMASGFACAGRLPAIVEAREKKLAQKPVTEIPAPPALPIIVPAVPAAGENAAGE